MSLFGFPEGLAGGSKETAYQTDYNTAFPTAYTTSHNTDKSTGYNTSHATTNAPTSWTSYSYALGGSWFMVNGTGSTFWQEDKSRLTSCAVEVKKPQHEGSGPLGWFIYLRGDWLAYGRRFWQYVGANYNFGSVWIAAVRSGWSIYGHWNGLTIQVNLQQNRNGHWLHDSDDRRTGSQTFSGVNPWDTSQDISFTSYYYCYWMFWYSQVRFGVQRTSHGETSQLTNKDTTYSTNHITSSPTSYSTDYTTEQPTQRLTSHITYG